MIKHTQKTYIKEHVTVASEIWRGRDAIDGDLSPLNYII